MKAIKTAEHQAQFWAFDSFVVDGGKSVLLRDGQPVPITPKAFEILLVLLRHHGQVLKKEELLELVWPDAFVEENNLPRTISALRKALGEEPAEHRFIVTVPGQGYRFVADVTELQSLNGEQTRTRPQKVTPDVVLPAVPASPISVPAKVRPNRRGFLTVCVILVLGLTTLGYFLYRLRSHPSLPSSQHKLWQLTFEPGLQKEPTWSPDGRFVAFTSDRSGNYDIWVNSVGDGKPLQITNSPAHDWQPDWSPDGLSLVFRSEREGGGLFVVPALGGSERKLCGFGYRPRWSPDGSQILFYSSAFPGVVKSKLYVISANGGSPQEVFTNFESEFSSPPHVAWHPDSHRMSLWGNHRQFGWTFWTMELPNGSPVRSAVDPKVEAQLKTAAVRFSDFVWLASGQSVIFEGESEGVKNLWKITVDKQSLRWIAGPERLTTSAGADTDIAVSSDGRKLAFSVRSEKTRLWTMPFDPVSGRVTGTGQPITVAGMDALQPGLSANGKMLVFRKQRGNKEDLWVKSLDDGRETLLAAADDYLRVTPIWSHDGSRVIYVRTQSSNLGRGEVDPQFDRLFALKTLGGSDEQVLTSSMPGRQSLTDWTADGKWILASSDWRTPGLVSLCLFPLDAAPHAETQMRVIASRPQYHLWQGHFSPNNNWISFNAYNISDGAVSQIYVVSTSGGQWIPITEGRYWDDKPRWSPDGKTIYFISNRTGFFNVWKVRFDSESGKTLSQPERVTDFESPSHMIMPYFITMEMALTTDRLILPITESSGSIWIMENLDQ